MNICEDKDIISTASPKANYNTTIASKDGVVVAKTDSNIVITTSTKNLVSRVY
jgi:hypothetical protein